MLFGIWRNRPVFCEMQQALIGCNQTIEAKGDHGPAGFFAVPVDWMPRNKNLPWRWLELGGDNWRSGGFEPRLTSPLKTTENARLPSYLQI
jgi:hypothetical protein